MRILGISAFYHDSAAALVEDGRIVGAAQEERFSRRKYDARFPRNAIAWCLEQARTDLAGVDHIVFYDKPFLKFERLIETYVSFAPRGFQSFRLALPLWIREKLFQKDLLRDELKSLGGVDCLKRLLFSEHHISHAASAFFPSPFEEAAILTVDGVGEWTTTAAGRGKANTLVIDKEIHFPHSLGLLYSAFTYYTGFRVNSGEYKLMGLAPFGEPRFLKTIYDHLLEVAPDGSFRLNLEYFDYCTGLTMTNDAFAMLFGAPRRDSDQPLTQHTMDVAASVQVALEETMLRLTRSLAEETGLENLCLAGGVALNCVANGRIQRDGSFKNVWIQPAPGDAGGALGAALAAYYMFQGQPRRVCGCDAMRGAYLGPEFSQAEIEARLYAAGANFTVLPDDQLMDVCAASLAEGRILGWFQGPMEFGPRSLGARSILADARSPQTQTVLNAKTKHRESFRPFAPSVLREEVTDWFELDVDSPYMLLVADVAESKRCQLTKEQQHKTGLDRLNVCRSLIPAVTHVDDSARVQTVHHETNPRFHDQIARFRQLTGCPVIVNTSFNVRGEPIVCTPEDAFRCFMGTEIDLLAVGNCLLRKENQPPGLLRDSSGSLLTD